MDKNSQMHFGLGALPATLGLTKSNLTHAAKLGLGAAAGITLTDLLLSRVLVKDGRPLVPSKWNPLAIGLGGVALGALTEKFGRKFLGGLASTMGEGMVAGTVGVAVAAVVAQLTAPAVQATVAAGESAELSGYGPQQTAGFGLGRAYALGLGGFSGAPQLAGANVMMEDVGLRGAAVQIEDAAPGFAGTLQ